MQLYTIFQLTINIESAIIEIANPIIVEITSMQNREGMKSYE